MNWITWLGIVSGIASIVSLCFTIRETKRAKNAASEAVRAKEAIFTKQSTLEIKAFLDFAGEIQQHLIKRTSPNQGSNQGHNMQKEHKLIEDFISKLNELRSLHPNKEFITVLDEEYKFMCKANKKEPKPYQDMLYHVRIIITNATKIVKTNLYN